MGWAVCSKKAEHFKKHIDFGVKSWEKVGSLLHSLPGDAGDFLHDANPINRRWLRPFGMLMAVKHG